MRSTRLRTLAGIAFLGAVPGGLVGIAVSPAWGWAFFAAALLAKIAYDLRFLARLDAWSRRPSPEESLEGSGLWDEIFARLYRHERGMRALVAQRDQALRQAAAAGQAIVDGIVTLDAENRILWCNRAAERQLGLDLRTDRGQPVANLVRQPAFVAYLAAGDFSQALRIGAVRNEEQTLSIHILPYASGERLVQVRDVTQSERFDRMRREFVANVSHELRTPLTVLSGFLETVRELPLEPEERNRYLTLMAEQSDRMQRIVQDLLTLSSLESSPPPPEKARVAMAALLSRLLRDAEALSGGRHAVALDVDEEAGDLLGAEGELLSAFGNLVSNAVRYTPAGGRIDIAWKRIETGAEFSVTDNGIGIAPEHLPRLTERFYRAERGRSRETGGTGLGLAIVKHVLSRHQAVLDIASRPGGGSRFSARFPLQRLVR